MAGFPEDVRRFIEDHIDSVELLHVLLLLRENPDRGWTVEQISTELQSSLYSIRRRLERLQKTRLASSRGAAFHYAAAAKNDALVQRLLELYRERRTTVIDVIFSAPVDPLRTFSDAFRLGDRRDDR